MSPVDYNILCEGYADRESRQWEYFRFVGFQVFNSYVDRKSNPTAPRTLQDYLPLPTDKKPPAKTKAQNKRETQKAAAAIKRIEDYLNNVTNG